MDFVINIFRGIFYTLDSIVYGLIPSVYSLLIQISRTSIFSQVEINAFSKRVYALIGIFMLFKVMVSIINYILNPDDFVDKEKGFTNIIKRVILSLVMLVIAPYIFEEAFNLQTIILEENTIMNLIFGTPSQPDSSGHDHSVRNSTYVDRAGRKIQFTLMYAFAQPNYQEFQNANYDLVGCEYTYKKDPSTNEYIFRSSSVTGGQSSYIYELEESCWGVYDPTQDKYVNDGSNGKLMQLFDDNDASNAYQNYAQGVAQQSFSLFFRREVVTAKSSDGRYFVNYRLGISTAVGVATLYLFLMFCVDIAVRSIQWGFLQMISPIPILSYCDPKSGKDGMFKKWFDKCKKVYLDLFIRLFALYFGIYIISLVGTFRDVVTHEELAITDNWILSIFMILGVLMFVKKLPDFLKETLNLDGSGIFKGYMNPLKKFEDEALGGKQIKQIAGMGLGAATGVGAATAGLLTGKGFHLNAIGKGIAGGFKGEKFGKNWSSSYGAAKEKHKQLQQMRAEGVSRGKVLSEKLRDSVGARTNAERVQTLSSQGKAIQSAYDQIKNQLIACDKAAGGAKEIAKNIDELKKTTISRESFTGPNAEADYQAAISAQRQRIQNMEAQLEARINSAVAGLRTGAFTTGAASADKVIKEQADLMNALKDKTNALGHSIDSSYAEIHAADDDVVQIMKQGKGIEAQAGSGKMQAYTDAGKYAGGSKK